MRREHRAFLGRAALALALGPVLGCVGYLHEGAPEGEQAVDPGVGPSDCLGEGCADEDERDPAAGCDPLYDDDSIEATSAAGYSGFVAPGRTREGHICEGDEDWYAVALEARVGPIRFALSFAHAEGDLNMAAFDAEGALLETSEGTGDEETIEGTGIAFVRVYGSSDADNGYRLSVLEGGDHGDPGGDDETPPGACDPGYDDDTLGAALAPGFGGSISAEELREGRICDGDRDFYLVEASAPDATVRVTIRFEHELGDLDMVAYDLEGSGFGSSRSAADDETIEGTGSFYVEVFGYDSAQNRYLILVVE